MKIPMHMTEQGAHAIAEHRSADPEGFRRTPAGRVAREDSAAVLAAVLVSQEDLGWRLYDALEAEWECFRNDSAPGAFPRCGWHLGSEWDTDEDRCQETWVNAVTAARAIFAEEVAR